VRNWWSSTRKHEFLYDSVGLHSPVSFLWSRILIQTFWQKKNTSNSVANQSSFSRNVRFNTEPTGCTILHSIYFNNYLLRRRSAAARLLRSWVRIPQGGMDVCCKCCVLSIRGLCDELTTHPEESYRLWYVVVCDLETSRMRRPWPALGRSAKKNNFYVFRADLLLITRRNYSVYTAVGAMLLCWLAVDRILPTARQHKNMAHLNYCMYRQVLRDDEQ
jgi:hypothetical protein